tara:strand:- start:799 stop:1491 length:693 start_codon:yes stop_codon:yes gene_type:complete
MHSFQSADDMGLKEMFELSALLKMQLPVLSSFAIFRWLIGLTTAVLSSRFPLAKARAGMTVCRRTLSVCGAGLLLLAYGHALETPVASMCRDFSNYKVQGYLCAASLLGLATSNGSIDLGLSLAALKGVADMSLFTLFLAPAPWVRRYCGTWIFFTVVILTSSGFAVECYSEGSSPAGAAVLAICFSLIYITGNAVFTSLLYCLQRTRAGARMLRNSLSKLIKVARGREA